jgi:hypothetical protein
VQRIVQQHTKYFAPKFIKRGEEVGWKGGVGRERGGSLLQVNEKRGTIRNGNGE